MCWSRNKFYFQFFFNSYIWMTVQSGRKPEASEGGWKVWGRSEEWDPATDRRGKISWFNIDNTDSKQQFIRCHWKKFHKIFINSAQLSIRCWLSGRQSELRQQGQRSSASSRRHQQTRRCDSDLSSRRSRIEWEGTEQGQHCSSWSHTHGTLRLWSYRCLVGVNNYFLVNQLHVFQSISLS